MRNPEWPENPDQPTWGTVASGCVGALLFIGLLVLIFAAIAWGMQ